MKQVEVTIMGQGYVLGCPVDGEALLQTAVASVDQEMSAIRDGNKVKARERIAVLAALNLAYRLAERAATPAAPQPTTEGETRPAANDADLAALVKRIDTALGDDDHLL
jgi:cell division protein ZapA